MFKIRHRFFGLLSLTPATAPLLHRHHLLKPLEIHIQNPHKFTTVHQIG